MTPLSSIFSTTSAGAFQTVSKWKQLGDELKSKSDEELSQWVASQTAADLAPGSYELIEWLENMPYEKILRCCNPEQARVALCWMTSGSMFSNPKTNAHTRHAINLFNSVDRLPVFVQVMRDSRRLYMNSIGVNDLLLRDSRPDSFFHNALPIHIKAILRMENPISFDRSVSVEDVDRKIDAYVEGLQKEEADRVSQLPPADLADLFNKA